MWIQDPRDISEIHGTDSHGAPGIWCMKYGEGCVFTDDFELLQLLGHLQNGDDLWWTAPEITQRYSQVLYWQVYGNGSARWLYYMPPDWEPRTPEDYNA